MDRQDKQNGTGGNMSLKTSIYTSLTKSRIYVSTKNKITINVNLCDMTIVSVNCFITINDYHLILSAETELRQ